MPTVPTILAAGELLVEFVSLEKGCGLRRITTFRGPFPSGAPGIFADQAALTGCKVLMVGAVAEDSFGDIILDRFAQDGVGTDFVARLPGMTTGSAFVSYFEDGSRTFVFNISNAAACNLTIDPRLLDLIAGGGVSWFHVSGSSLGDPKMAAVILQLFDAVRAGGGRISYDPNVRKEIASNPDYASMVGRVLTGTDLFLPSSEDLSALFPGASEADAIARAFEAGVGRIALKKGSQGCAYFTPAESFSLPGHVVDVVDATGAGDCFCATFVALTALGHDPRDGLALANAAAAMSVTEVGPMEGNRALADVKKFLATTA
jgi:fructokinase